MELGLLQAGNYREEYMALVGGLLLRPWWQRMWIVQEVAVSNDLVVVCGSKAAAWSAVINFMNIASTYHEPVISQTLPGANTEGFYNLSWGVRLQSNRSHWHKSGSLPLFQLPANFRSWKATKPEDKVYGILGMATQTNHPALKPDYQKQPQEFFRIVTRFIIEEERKLDIVCLATVLRRLDHLPSWTPELTVPTTDVAPPLKTAARLLEPYLYSTAQTTMMNASFSLDSKTMYAQGIQADFVDHLAVYWDPNLSLHEFDETLLESTQIAWFGVMQPMLLMTVTRYVPGTLFGIIMGKLLTADRVSDFSRKISRFEPDKSWSDLPMEPPEDYRHEGTAQDQEYQWLRAKKHLIEGALTQRRSPKPAISDSFRN